MVKLWLIVMLRFLIFCLFSKYFIINKYCLLIREGWSQNPVSLAVVFLVLSLFVVVVFLSIRERAGQRKEQGNSRRVTGQHSEMLSRGEDRGGPSPRL